MDAIKTTPSEITLYDRNGEESMKLTPGQVNFGPPITTVYIKDPFTGEKRRATREDAKNAARAVTAIGRSKTTSVPINDGQINEAEYKELTIVLSEDEIKNSPNIRPSTHKTERRMTPFLHCAGDFTDGLFA